MHAAEPFPHFVDDYLNYLYEAHPSGATMDGVHMHDDLLEDYRRGAIDAHVSAPAARATAPGQMVAIMGTSTCHVMSSDTLREVPGMCGVVDGGIIDGLYGYEAGQSGVGDIFGWFTAHFVPGRLQEEAAERGLSVHELLTEQASREPVGAHGLLALDWQSGNRSVLVDHELSGTIVGIAV